MEDFGWLIFIIAVWALVYAFVVNRRRRRDAEETGQKLTALQSQLDNLRQHLAKSAGELSAAVPASVQAAAAPAHQVCSKCGYALEAGFEFCIRCGARVVPATVPARPAVAAPVSPPVSSAPPVAASHSAAPAQAPLTIPKPAAAGATSPPPASVTPPPPPVTPPRVSVPPAAPPPTAAAAKPAPRPVTVPSFAQPKPKKPRRSLEEVLVKLLPIIGIAIVVIGVAFLVSYKWASFPNWLRATLLYTGSFGLLGSGIFFERKKQYARVGRALIGGGWACIALLTYAIGNTKWLRLFESGPADLLLLMIVIAAMVAHTLKYDSQLVTGAGFLLGVVAIGMNPAPPFNLLAGAMLIVGMTVIVLRRQWYELEVAGIVASYANHFIWLYFVYDKQGGRAIFPHHSASVALAIGYWVIFRASYLLRKISAPRHETTSTLAGLLNPILFLTVMAYQGFHPEWAWWLLLSMGATEFVLGQLPVSRRRSAPFQILSSLGFVLMVTAAFRKFSGNSLDLIWLAGAETFLLAGIFTRERLFRAFGIIVSFLVAVHAGAKFLVPLSQQVVWEHAPHDGQLSLLLVLIAAAFYANAHATRRLWPKLFQEGVESVALTVLSFVASVFAAGAIYAYVPEMWVALALALLVVWLSGTGKLYTIPEMVYQAHWVAAVAFIQLAVIGDDLTSVWWKIPHRVLEFSGVAAMLYLSSRFVRLSDTRGKAAFSAVYAWAATGLLALLIWYQFHSPGWAVAVLWIVLGLALAMVGHYLKRNDFKWQAFALVLASTVRALSFNFEHAEMLAGQPGSWLSHISYRLVSVSLCALGIYLLARWAPLKSMRPVYTVIGTGLLAFLIYREAPAPWTAVAWIALALALCLAARWWKDRALLWQTHALAAMAAAWSLYLFYVEPRGTRLQWITVGITVALFYALTWISNIATIVGDERLCQAYAWIGSLLLSWLVWAQLDPSLVALAWCVFGVLLYELPDLLGPINIDTESARGSWHAQAYVALVSSFVYIFLANLNAPRAVGIANVLKDPHVLPVMVLPFLYFYVYWRMRQSAGRDKEQAKSMAKVVAA